MGNIKRLIQGQNVRFDTHQSGDGQPTNWQNVHLEKILHEGGKIRFPMMGEFEPSWSARVSAGQLARVQREVRRELEKDPALVKELAKTVVSVLNRFSSGAATIENAKSTAEKFAGYFGLDKNFERMVTDYMDGRLVEFISYHVNPDSEFLEEISLTSTRIEIRKSRKKAWVHKRSKRSTG